MSRDASLSLFDRYFFGPVDLLRPFLLSRLLLALLAFDCWLDLASFGFRYGFGGFNVAHFAVLDALLPMPSPEVYVGLVLAVGFLALTMALTRPTRAGLLVLASGYTLAWSWSLLDAYQHHYLLSILLFVMACFPPTPFDAALASELHPDANTRADRQAEKPVAWGFVLFCVSCAIVYFYTAITKMNADWRDGHALARLAGPTPAGHAMVELAQEYGVGADVFWSGFAKSAIALQLVIALGFLMAPVVDRLPRLRARRLLAFWVVAPLSFHVGAAHMQLEIGWFTEYMLIVAVVVFVPRELLVGAAQLLGAPLRGVRAWLDAEAPARGVAVVGLLVAGAALVGLFGLVDLPGDRAAGVAAALLLALLAFAPLRRGDTTVALPLALGSLVAGGALLFALAQSDARFDYYRKAGGDSLRLGSPEEPQYYLDAVAHYQRAQRDYPDAYREFWEEWDRAAAARVARGEPAPDEARAQDEGAPPRDRARQLANAEARVAALRAQGVLPPE